MTVGQAVDERNVSAGGRDIPEESLMLTGDENIVDIDFSVFWLIGNAANYLFNMADPDGTVKAAAESTMRQVVGQSNIQDLLTQARQITESQVQTLLQKTLDQYGAGITVTQVQLLKVDPPAEVVASFRDVQAAQADQVRLQNEAQSYANKVVPRGQGPGVADHQCRQRLSRPHHRRGQRPGAGVRQRLPELQGRAGGHPRADVPGDHGAGPLGNEQDHHRREERR